MALFRANDNPKSKLTKRNEQLEFQNQFSLAQWLTDPEKSTNGNMTIHSNTVANFSACTQAMKDLTSLEVLTFEVQKQNENFISYVRTHTSASF